MDYTFKLLDSVGSSSLKQIKVKVTLTEIKTKMTNANYIIHNSIGRSRHNWVEKTPK